MKSAATPKIIERASVAAVAVPWTSTVNPSEANATEGAAPNSPANVFGLRTSEITENTDTTKPPIKNRMMRSFNVSPIAKVPRAQLAHRIR